MTSYHNLDEQFRERIEDWLGVRRDISERDGALENPTTPDEWESSEDEAADIVRDLAAYMGIDVDNIWTVELTNDSLEDDGEKGYTFVVDADSEDEAVRKSEAEYNSWDPGNMPEPIITDVSQGMPEHDDNWNDIRYKQFPEGPENGARIQ